MRFYPKFFFVNSKESCSFRYTLAISPYLLQLFKYSRSEKKDQKKKISSESSRFQFLSHQISYLSLVFCVPIGTVKITEIVYFLLCFWIFFLFELS